MDLLDIHLDRRFKTSHISGIYHDLLTGLQNVLHQIAVDLHEGHTPPGKPLHDEALTAEDPGTQPLVEVNRKIHTCLRGQESTLLHDHLLTWADLQRLDLTGEA